MKPVTQHQKKALLCLHSGDELPFTGGVLAAILKALRDRELIDEDKAKLTEAGKQVLGITPPPKPKAGKRIVPKGASPVLQNNKIVGYLQADPDFPALFDLFVFVDTRAVKIGGASNPTLAEQRIIKKSEELESEKSAG